MFSKAFQGLEMRNAHESSALRTLHTVMRRKTEPNREPRGLDARKKSREIDKAPHFSAAMAVIILFSPLFKERGKKFPRQLIYSPLKCDGGTDFTEPSKPSHLPNLY